MSPTKASGRGAIGFGLLSCLPSNGLEGRILDEPVVDRVREAGRTVVTNDPDAALVRGQGIDAVLSLLDLSLRLAWTPIVARNTFPDAAERFVPDETEPLPWAAICKQYPDQYVWLVDVENGPDGAIRSGRVVGHDRSMRQLLEQIDVPRPASVVVQTSGRALRIPRVEMTDEIRNIVRPQR